MNNFKELKQEIIDRARKAGACATQYGRAYKSESIEELCNVIKDNFFWSCRNEVLTGELIEKFKEEFAENKIFHNVSVESGFMIASGSSTVEASGSSTVEAYDSSTVKAYDSSTVEAYDSSTVKASGSSTVKAYDSSTVKASGSSTVKAYDSSYIYCKSTIECTLQDKAVVRRWDTNTIQYISPELIIEKL